MPQWLQEMKRDLTDSPSSCRVLPCSGGDDSPYRGHDPSSGSARLACGGEHR